MTDKSILDFTQQHEFFAQELLFFCGDSTVATSPC